MVRSACGKPLGQFGRFLGCIAHEGWPVFDCSRRAWKFLQADTSRLWAEDSTYLPEFVTVARGDEKPNHGGFAK
jgi:hypothetical protein